MFSKTMLASAIGKYKKMSVQVRAALWYTICTIIQKSLSFLVMPIFTRIMSQEDYGLYTVYNSWYWIVVVFATLNLYNGIFNNGMQDYKENRDSYTSSLQSIGSIAAIVCYFVYFLFRDIVEEYTGLNFYLCSLMFLQAFFTPALYYWQGRQRYEYKYQKMIIVTLLIAFFRPLTSAIVVIVSHNKGLARVVSFATFEIFVGFMFYTYNLIRGKKVYDRQIWKSALLFAIPLVPHYLSQTFLSHLDKLMIDKYCGREPVAIYEIAYTVAMVTIFINTSINGSFVPWIYDCLEKKETRDISRITNRLFVVIGGINFFVILFAKEIVFILGDKAYADAAYIIPVLSWSVFYVFLYTIFGDIEFYYKKTTYTMYGSLIACALNVVLNYIFIKSIGYQAAAYTTLVSYIILALTHFGFVRKLELENDLGHIFDYKFITFFSVIGTVACIFMQVLYKNDLIRYGVIVVFVSIIFVLRSKIIELLKMYERKK